jgi:hypothetical protein
MFIVNGISKTGAPVPPNPHSRQSETTVARPLLHSNILNHTADRSTGLSALTTLS